MTICTQNKLYLFGEIINDEMVLNDAGMLVDRIWHKMPGCFSNIKLHEFTIMPNHIHGIIEIIREDTGMGCRKRSNNPSQAGQPQGIAPTLGDVVGAFKSLTTNEYIKKVKQNILPVFDKRIWQRNYWEHVIRNENDYQKITQYIMDNPKHWALDKLNTESCRNIS